MFQIQWVELVLATGILALAIWELLLVRRSGPGWERELAAALQAQVTSSRTLGGVHDGMAFMVRRIAGPNASVRWRVELPDFRGPCFAVARETSGGRLLKRLGFASETPLNEAELDRLLFVASHDPPGLTALFHVPEVEAALAALWPRADDKKDGHLEWVQSGTAFIAVLNLWGVPNWTERFPVLLTRVVKFARAVAAAPVTLRAGPPIPIAALDSASNIWLPTVVLVFVSPTLLVGSSVLAALTASAKGFHTGLFAACVGAALVAIAVRVARHWRRAGIFRELWLGLALLVLSIVLGVSLPVGVNLLGASAPHTEEVEVTSSREREVGVLAVWRLELGGHPVEYELRHDVGSRLQKGQHVRTTWVTGMLGQRRLLELVAVPKRE